MNIEDEIREIKNHLDLNSDISNDDYRTVGHSGVLIRLRAVKEWASEKFSDLSIDGVDEEAPEEFKVLQKLAVKVIKVGIDGLTLEERLAIRIQGRDHIDVCHGHQCLWCIISYHLPREWEDE